MVVDYRCENEKFVLVALWNEVIKWKVLVYKYCKPYSLMNVSRVYLE